MAVQIIIDRVGNTNVFNIIEDRAVNNPVLDPDENMISVTDDDLLQEYLEELNRIANISRSLSSLPRSNEEDQALIFQHLNLNTKLRQIGEAIFRQFFPPPLQKFLRDSRDTYLYFHTDMKLASLPFEILHDGSDFLWEKFYLGKSIKGLHSAVEETQPKEALNMLIVADPTEDLDWARKEGEILFEHLTANFPEKLVNVELLGGRSITKLNLLNQLIDKDIVHYCGHLHYSDTPEENGWILFDRKVMHAREFRKSGAAPQLIFSNSCLSGRAKNQSSSSDWYARFAGAFIRSGKTSYIGTNWELPDREPTINFTLEFYRQLLEGESLGKALQKSRLQLREKYTLNDLTWASYLLIGNPASKVFQAESRVPDLIQNILDYDKVINHYPFPIARAFQNFIFIQGNEDFDEVEKNRRGIMALRDIFSQTVLFLGSVIMANYRYLSLPKQIRFPNETIRENLDAIYSALNGINALKIQTLVTNLLETMFVHRDNLYKVQGWLEDLDVKTKSAQTVESLNITVQYMLEGFLMDMEFIKNYGFYRIVEPGHRQLSLSGVRINHRIREILLPTQANNETHQELIRKTGDIVGHLTFYNPVKKIFLDLSPWMELSMQGGEKKDQDYIIRYPVKREQTRKVKV